METNTLRFIVLGNTKTGKTTYFNRLKDNYTNKHSTTIGVDVHTFIHKLYNYNSKIIIWDTAGRKRFKSIVNSYIANNCGYILFFDLNNKESFLSLEKWIEEIKHYNTCKHEHPIFLIGNKKDLLQKVDNHDIGNLVEKYKLIYITTSCTDYDSHIIMDAIINEIFVRFIGPNDKCNGIH
uniref:GTP-binding protein n=1 Tax=viral metagenome TaxID=1070528 RepID=A0A6C0EHR1_9ZZZZ